VTTDGPAGLVIPEDLFPRTRGRFPALLQLIDEAELAMPGMDVLADKWYRDCVAPQMPVHPSGQTLLFRLALFSVAVTRRGIQLSEAIAREVEADSSLARQP
jgi:hypothetical protein